MRRRSRRSTAVTPTRCGRAEEAIEIPRRNARAVGELDEKRARLAAADLLSRRAMSVAELRSRLVRRGAPPEVADAVVADLGARGYVDDAAFARHWVETRAPRGYGATRLRAELRARGVASPLIDGALAVMTPDATLARTRDAARRRLPALARGRPDRAAARLRDHLLRRGFPPGIVARVVREALGAGAEE